MAESSFTFCIKKRSTTWKTSSGFRMTSSTSIKIIIVVLLNATVFTILLLNSHDMLFSLSSTSEKGNRNGNAIDGNNIVIGKVYTMHGQRYHTNAVEYNNFGGPYHNNTYIQFRTEKQQQYESDWEKQFPRWKRVVYKKWFRKIKKQHHNAFNESKCWYEWLDSSNSTVTLSDNTHKQQQVVPVPHSKSNHTILKLLCITLEEWPWIVHWVVYHGKLIGFENLYIVSGDILDDTATMSTPSSSTTKTALFARKMSRLYLQHVRDRLNVNVIFSSSNLNQLMEEVNEISNNIRTSCHFLMKMDPDEFLSVAFVETNNQTNQTKGNNHSPIAFCNDFTSGTNCTFTPYHVQEYLDTQLPLLANGTRIFIGFIAQSIPNATVCNDINTTSNNDTENDDNGIVLLNVTTQQLGLFAVSSIHPIEAFYFYKVIMDSRTYRKHDLGGHFGTMIGMFDKIKEVKETVEGSENTTMRRRLLQKSSLGIYHFHFRCVTTETLNSRKACISHGYINATDPINEVLLKLQNEYIGPGVDPCTLQDTNSMSKSSIQSPHKVLEYAQHLSCPNTIKQTFYPTNTPFVPDQTFYTYLHNALEEYDDWKHISIPNSNSK